MFLPWFRSGPAASASLRLICFPYAGGGASAFHSWHASVPAWVQVCPVHLPGRETRFNEPPLGDLGAMVRELASATDDFLDCSYALFGHSLGALIAFELARELRKRNRPKPMRFFPSASQAPQLPQRHQPISHLNDEDFLDRVAEIGDIPAGAATHKDVARLILPALRGDFKMCEEYEYLIEPPFAFPITALSGTYDSWVNPGDLVPWHSQTTAQFNLRLLEGGHLFLRSSPNQVIHTVLETLRNEGVPEPHC